MPRSIMLTLLLCGALVTAASAQRARVGQPAPEIGTVKLLNANQESVTLESLRGKVVILEFWATWCGPCIATAKHLDELKEELGDKLVVLSLSGESESTVTSHLRRKPSNAMVGVYSGSTIDRNYPHSAIPHGILIDQNGKVVEIDHPMSWNASTINQLYAGGGMTSSGSSSSSSAGGNSRDWDSASDRNNVKKTMGGRD